MPVVRYDDGKFFRLELIQGMGRWKVGHKLPILHKRKVCFLVKKKGEMWFG